MKIRNLCGVGRVEIKRVPADINKDHDHVTVFLNGKDMGYFHITTGGVDGPLGLHFNPAPSIRMTGGVDFERELSAISFCLEDRK